MSRLVMQRLFGRRAATRLTAKGAGFDEFIGQNNTR